MESVQPERYHTYLHLSSLITTMRLESHAADDLEGLFAFFYVCLHFLTCIGPDQSFDLGGMWRDIEKRHFITAGLLGFALMIPLALTSTAGWIRRLGGKRWQTLHRAIYVTAICGVIHYYWLVKSDVRKPLFYGALVAILLLWRLGIWFRKRCQLAAASPEVHHTATQI